MPPKLQNVLRSDGREIVCPEDARGSRLVVGMPSLARGMNEPTSVGLLYTILKAVQIHRAQIVPAILEASLKIDIFGALPWHLTHGADFDAARHEAVHLPHGDARDREQIGRRLREIEERQASVVASLVGLLYRQDDIAVETYTERLRTGYVEGSRGRQLERGRLTQQFHAAENIRGGEQELQISADRSERFNVSLARLVPGWAKKNLDSKAPGYHQRLKTLAHYVLLELFEIMNSVTDQRILLHYFRERAYLPVATAYMELFGDDDAKTKVDQYVFMPELDDLKLPSPPSAGATVNPASSKLTLSESYRVGEGHDPLKLLIFPADTVDAMMEKLNAAHITPEVRLTYLKEVVAKILELVRVLNFGQAYSRKKIEKLLPAGLLEDDTKLLFNMKGILRALYELVMEPSNEVIQQAVSMPNGYASHDKPRFEASPPDRKSVV